MPHPNSKATAWRSCLRPGRLRAVYLRQWLEHDLPSRWLDKPFLIQFGFALALHDRPGDVMHALSGLRQARRNQARDMDALLEGESCIGAIAVTAAAMVIALPPDLSGRGAPPTNTRLHQLAWPVGSTVWEGRPRPDAMIVPH